MTRPGVSILAACVTLATAGWVPAAQPSAQVRVDRVRMQRVANWREVTGSIRPSRRSEMATQERGLVVDVSFDEGDRVETGDVLVRLESERASLELQRAEAIVRSREATIREREADLDEARRDQDRVEQSAAKGSATQTEVDDAATDVARAEARLAVAEAELASARSEAALANRRLEDMTIEAPFAGYVVRTDTEVGQWLSEGQTVLELLELDSVEVWLDVPERYLFRLTDEGLVRIRIDAAGIELESSLTGVVPEVDSLSRLAPVWVRIDNRDGAIKPGMTVVGLVPTGQLRELPTVHKDAILRDDAGEFVYFNAGGTAAPARIERLFAVGERVAIRHGTVPPGTQVVVEGNERLFPGQPLTVMNADGAAPPAGGPGGSG